MKTININPLSQESIENAIKLLEEYQRKLSEKNDSFVKNLADVGANTASEVYANATFDSAHRNYSVTALQEGSGKASVVASGSDVGFLEFGFGITQPGWSGNISYPPHGSISNRAWWWYGGHISSGSPPSEGMLVALRTMGENAGDVAKEVFGGD